MPAKITSPLASDDSQFWQSVEAKTPNPSLPVECLKRPPTGLRLRGVRYMILVLGTLNLSLILGCVICFSPALTVMMNVNSSASFNSSESEDSNNPWNWDVPLADRRFPFTNMEKSLLLAGTFGACLFQILPVGYSMQLFGAWRTQLAIGFSVSMATGLIPFAASLNFYALLIVRMVLGLAITNLFPVVGCICNAWAPQAERGTFLALLSGYVQLAIIISMPLSGFLCDKFGWPSVFFVHSVLGLLLTALWAFFYKDDPRKHRWITEEELALILAGKGDQSADKANNKKPPYGRILSTSQIWAIFCAVAGNFLVVQFSNTFLPMFLVTAMHFSNSDTGMISALPLIIQFGAKWLTGIATDHLPKVPDIIKVRFCNSTAFCGAAFFFLLASLFPPETFTPWPAVACLVFCIGILGLNSGGYPKSAVLVAAQYTPTVMAGVQTMLCATIFIGSFIVPAMTSNGGQFWEYRRVFYLYAAALLVSNLVFVLFGKASPAKWTRMEKEEMEKTRF